MLLAVDVHPEGAELARCVVEEVRHVVGDVEHEGAGILGLSHHRAHAGGDTRAGAGRGRGRPWGIGSEGQGGGQPAAVQHVGPELLGQHRAGAEQLVEDQGPADVGCNGCSVVKPMPASTCWQCRATVRADRPAKRLGHGRHGGRRVLPGAIEQPRPWPRRRPGSRPGGAAPPGTRRWAGRTGRGPGRAGGPARAWSARRPTSSWPRASWPSATACAQSAPAPGAPSAPRGTEPVTSSRPRSGSRPPIGRSSSAAGRHEDGAVRVASAGHHQDGRRRGQRGRPESVARRSARPSSTARRRRGAAAAAAPPRWARAVPVAPSAPASTPGRARRTWRAPSRPGIRRAPRRQSAGSASSASRHPRSVEGGVECARRCTTRRRVAHAAREQRRARRAPSAVVPEVEQAAGDDVALDLGAAAVDGGGTRVEVLGSASAGSPGRRRRRTSAPGRRPTRSKTACSAVATRTLSTDVSAPSVSPAASRRWVARDRARKAQRSCGRLAERGRVERARGRCVDQLLAGVGAGRRPGATAPCCARRAAGPWRSAQPPSTWPSDAVERDDDVVEEDLAELGGCRAWSRSAGR